MVPNINTRSHGTKCRSAGDEARPGTWCPQSTSGVIRQTATARSHRANSKSAPDAGRGVLTSQITTAAAIGSTASKTLIRSIHSGIGKRRHGNPSELQISTNAVQSRSDPPTPQSRRARRTPGHVRWRMTTIALPVANPPTPRIRNDSQTARRTINPRDARGPGTYHSKRRPSESESASRKITSPSTPNSLNPRLLRACNTRQAASTTFMTTRPRPRMHRAYRTFGL